MCICGLCKERRPESEFPQSALRENRGRCRTCSLEYARDYRKSNPMTMIRMALSSREKRRGTPLARTIVHEDLYALFENEFGKDQVAEAIKKYSLDRLDPDEPWSLSNNMFALKNTRPHNIPSKSICDETSSSLDSEKGGEEEEAPAPLKRLRYVFDIEEEEKKNGAVQITAPFNYWSLR